MRTIKGDIFALPNNGDAICVTTNGIVKADGTAVMGKGIAKKFALQFPELPRLLGKRLAFQGNHVHRFEGRIERNGKNIYCHVFSFPTKENWRDNSDLELIKRSCRELKEHAESQDINTIYLPVPGCGLGGLKEEDVLPEVEKILDTDQFVLVKF